MTLTLELTPKQEQQLRAEAERRGLDEASYAKSQLFGSDAAEIGEENALPPTGPLPPADGTGADLVAYWKREGLIGTHPDSEEISKLPLPGSLTPSEIVAYWEKEGVLKPRPDLPDSPVYARQLREEAQDRVRG